MTDGVKNTDTMAKVEEALGSIWAAAPSRGKFWALSPSLFDPNEGIILAKDGGAVLVSQKHGKIVISEFCQCSGGTKLGNEIRKTLEAGGLPVRD